MLDLRKVSLDRDSSAWSYENGVLSVCFFYKENGTSKINTTKTNKAKVFILKNKDAFESLSINEGVSKEGKAYIESFNIPNLTMDDILQIEETFEEVYTEWKASIPSK